MTLDGIWRHPTDYLCTVYNTGSDRAASGEFLTALLSFPPMWGRIIVVAVFVVMLATWLAAIWVVFFGDLQLLCTPFKC
jgi:hypothetical protein